MEGGGHGLFWVPSQHSPGKTEENHEKPRPVQLVAWLIVELDTSQMQGQCVTIAPTRSV